LTLVVAAPSSRQIAGAIALAICCGDGALRARLERLAGADASLSVVGTVGDAAALERLIGRHRVDVAVVRSPAMEQLRRWTRRYRATAFVAIIDDALDAGMDVLHAGARALLSDAAADADITITLQAVARGLCVLPGHVAQSLQTAGPIADDQPRPADAGPLTARELDVLAAMADGASNKAIARRLGISFHTVKFHVAGILAKLDADSRTEAVTKAAQLGLVML
jgi:DNA-binding NarL/FixJ family response regulator